MNKLQKLQGNPNKWAEKLKIAKKEYNYQPQLTQKLDDHYGDFTETTILEIVLWKINRYPGITSDILSGINNLRKHYSKEEAKKLLKLLLEERGYGLPMASTVLRFACPKHLQIIDQRVYRIITTDKDNLIKSTKTDTMVQFYFDYIERLKEYCKKYDVEFVIADRVLYQLDIMENKNIKLKN